MNIVPSIEMIPAKYSAGILLCQEPLDGSGDFSVTRATNVATRFNAAGFIETVTSGLPRLDYYTSDGTPGCPALLVEPAATNIITYSEIFIQGVSSWINTQVNISSGYTSPSNSDNASFIESISVGSRMRLASPAFTSGTTNTISIFAKIGTQSNGFTITVQDGVNTSYTSGVCQVFLLDSGTLGASGSVGSGFSIVNSRIENYGNGWYRCSISVLTSFTPSAATITIRNASILTANLPTVVPGNNCYIWGVQLETGSVATSYIPTTESSVTRDADVINKTGVSGLIGQTEGVLYAEFVPPSGSTGRVFAIDDGSVNNRIVINRATTTRMEVIVRSSGSVTGGTIGSSAATAFNPDAPNKVAYAYKSGDFALAINGSVVASGTTTFTFTSSLNTLGTSESTIGIFMNRLRSVAIYKTRLPNYLLESATSQIQSYSALASSLSYTVV